MTRARPRGSDDSDDNPTPGPQPAAAPRSDDADSKALEAAQESHERELAARQELFAAFHERHRPALLRFAGSRAKAPVEAKDLLQEALCNLWTHDALKECGGDDEKMLAYAITSIRNLESSQNRKARFAFITGSRYAAWFARRWMETKTPFDNAADNECEGHIDRLQAQLPPRCRDAFVLVRRLDMKRATAAEALGMSLGTLNVHLTKAHLFIRKGLAACGYGDAFDKWAEKKEQRP